MVGDGIFSMLCHKKGRACQLLSVLPSCLLYCAILCLCPAGDSDYRLPALMLCNLERGSSGVWVMEPGPDYLCLGADNRLYQVGAAGWLGAASWCCCCCALLLVLLGGAAGWVRLGGCGWVGAAGWVQLGGEGAL